MKLSLYLSLGLLQRASCLCSAFQVPSAVATTPVKNSDRLQSKVSRASSAMLGIFPASLLHPIVAHAMLESRVPVPTSPGGVELLTSLTSNKHLSRTAILLTCALYIVVAIEWNGFEYFRHLAGKIRDLTKEEEMSDVGLAKESDWNTYTHLLDPLQKKKKFGMRSRIGNLFRRMNTSKGIYYAYTLLTMQFYQLNSLLHLRCFALK